MENLITAAIDSDIPFSRPVVNQDIGLGRGVYVSTYGCQMNVNDTERMYTLLEMANFSNCQYAPRGVLNYHKCVFNS